MERMWSDGDIQLVMAALISGLNLQTDAQYNGMGGGCTRTK